MSSAPTMALPPEGVRRLQAATPDGWELVVVQAPTESSGDGTNVASDEAMQAIESAEVYFGYGLPASLLAAAPHLRWAHSASAGVGKSITSELLSSRVVFTNSAGVYAEAMADSVLAGVLHFVRGLDHAAALQARSAWDKRPFQNQREPLLEVSGLRVLVLGAGGIGSAVASRFTALGAVCTGIRRRPELGTPPGFSHILGPDRLDDGLKAADVMVCAAPLTAASRNMLDARRLALLPQGAIVVNVARGALVDESALLDQLQSGRLRGAYLDVFREEPLPEASPLWSSARVLITPHVSGVSPARHWGRALALFEDNWRRWVAGEPLRNVVDPAAGY